MSYLENGSTLRAMFRLMPPMRHDIDPNRSEVLAYIMQNMRCDMGRAIRSFNSMRHVKSAVLIFDRIHRQWRGCDWMPAEETDKVSLLMNTITEMKRDISSLRSEVRRVKHEMVSLRRRKGRREQEDCGDDEQEEKSSPDENLEELKRKKEEQEAAHFRKIQEMTKDPAFWGETPVSPSPAVPSVVILSSTTGSTVPTEYPWENDEDVVS